MTHRHNPTCAALIEEFGCREIPLAKCCARYFAMSPTYANIQAASHALPVPAYRSSGRKGTWLVRAEDLAAHLDTRHDEATQQWRLKQEWAR